MDAYPGLNLTTSNFTLSENLFRDLGLSLESIVDGLNFYITMAADQQNFTIIRSVQLYFGVLLVSYILDVSSI